ncbi:uncharacterized protein B0I36DRAFT_430737 [Microdochium trichocladiopsis]|uniref:Zn(2)-C6 fungal-type domain-containing protein n=1 Tax=Microdochium trichocladiopsis TaxID=1682393 RepID=A0A9P8Y7D7_9PEZI|nr:uncharacterized protein B0I36DRAFT_430737 [Microdochium trichocladiopsis]KAH7033540.1 hypothetical protein B0I36DRAFT_430737 [Microdochium trichocladiopsis]
MTPGSDSSPKHARTEVRLALACNQCRRRKVRCDASLPKCRNCAARGDNCDVSDLRRRPKAGSAAQAPVRRRAEGRRRQSRQQRPSPGSPPVQAPLSPSRSTASPAAAPGHSKTATATALPLSRTAAVAAAAADTAAAAVPGKSSWLALGYIESRSLLRYSQQAAGLPAGSRQVLDACQGGTHDDDAALAAPEVVLNVDHDMHKLKFVGGSSLQCLCRFVDLHLVHHRMPTISPFFKHGMRHAEEFSVPVIPTFPPIPTGVHLRNLLDVSFSRQWPLFPVIDRVIFEVELGNIMGNRTPCSGHSRGPAYHHIDVKNIQPVRLPWLAAAYSILCIATDYTQGRTSETSAAYLKAAYSLYNQLVSMPFLPSVQATLLLALALREQGRDGQAWHLTGHAVRTAHSLGLHKQKYISMAAMQQQPLSANSTDVRKSQKARDSRHLTASTAGMPVTARVWLACYALEKLMQLECGRPSIIDDADITGVRSLRVTAERAHGSEHGPAQEKDVDQPPNERRNHVQGDADNGGRTPEPSDPHHLDYFLIWVRLSRIIGKIAERVYLRKYKSSAEMFYETGKLDMELLDWEASLPAWLSVPKTSWAGGFPSTPARPPHSSETIEPDDDGGNAQPHHGYLQNLILSQFYNAQISLFRISLIFSQESYQKELRVHPSPVLPAHFHARLSRANLICVEAARAVITQNLQFVEGCLQVRDVPPPESAAATQGNSVNDHLPLASTPPPPLLAGTGGLLLTAASVLALSILREPTRRLTRSDAELLGEAATFASECYARWGQDPAFSEVCGVLRDSVDKILSKVKNNGKPGRQASVAPGASPASTNNQLGSGQVRGSSSLTSSSRFSRGIAPPAVNQAGQTDLNRDQDTSPYPSTARAFPAPTVRDDAAIMHSHASSFSVMGRDSPSFLPSGDHARVTHVDSQLLHAEIKGAASFMYGLDMSGLFDDMAGGLGENIFDAEGALSIPPWNGVDLDLEHAWPLMGISLDYNNI